MKKWLVLEVGLLAISAGLIFAGGPKASFVAFTLAISAGMAVHIFSCPLARRLR
jgi:altronate dehydratase